MRAIAGILVVLLLVGGLIFPVLAQDPGGETQAAAEAAKAARDRCLRNFNMARIVFEDKFKEMVRLKNDDLYEYMWCRGIFDPDFAVEQGIVSWMNEGSAFLNFKFWRQFLSEGKVTPALVVEFASDNDVVTGGDIAIFLNAFLRKDPSVCDKIRISGGKTAGCRAMITLDPSGFTERADRDLIYFLRALTRSNAKECDGVKDPKAKAACVASVTLNPNACEGLRGFNRFRRTYCGS